jgi:hypothetical protein
MLETHSDTRESLAWKEVDAFMSVIHASIIERYDGDLERHEDPRGKRNDLYVPLDHDQIRELLTKLWAEHVTVGTIEDAFDNLVNYGAEDWPHAWCEEELEAEREQQLSYLDYEIECTEQQLAKLKHELNQLLGT